MRILASYRTTTVAIRNRVSRSAQFDQDDFVPIIIIIIIIIIVFVSVNWMQMQQQNDTVWSNTNKSTGCAGAGELLAWQNL